MSQSSKRLFFSEHYDEYDQWYDSHPREYEEHLDFLRPLVPSGKGLEIGVGTGRFACPLGIEFGIDYAEGMVEESRKRGVRSYLADAVALPFQDKFFDYCFSIVTLCFLDDPEAALKEASRVAKSVITVIIDRDSEFVKNKTHEKHGFYKYASFFAEAEVVGMYLSSGLKDVKVARRDLQTSDGQSYRIVAVTGK